MRRVISASRRSDIASHHLDWLVASLKKGWVEVENPFNRKKYRVSLKKRDVHTLVLWSKDFRHLIKRVDEFSGYHLFLLFTINSPSPLEEGLSSLPERLAQLKDLTRLFGAERVVWRFDPIVLWKDTSSGKQHDNLSHFGEIADAVANVGIRRCIISFVTPYKKVVNRMKRAGMQLMEPPADRKREIVAEIARRNRRSDIETYACCNPDIVGVEGIKRASCIDGRRLSLLAGEPCDVRKDRGQRSECGCTSSTDIGRYNSCPSGCLYCYAVR